jgi:hypothetical protein
LDIKQSDGNVGGTENCPFCTSELLILIRLELKRMWDTKQDVPLWRWLDSSDRVEMLGVEQYVSGRHLIAINGRALDSRLPSDEWVGRSGPTLSLPWKLLSKWLDKIESGLSE